MKHKTARWIASAFCCMVALASGAAGLREDFANPPDSAKPWCYWWWINGHADRETITADLEAMKRLGFGGVLMFDSRGYWDDENHVVNPKAEIVWGSPEWYGLVEFSIRECARLGLEFTMNASASGGTLNGFIDGREYETDVMDHDAGMGTRTRAQGLFGVRRTVGLGVEGRVARLRPARHARAQRLPAGRVLAVERGEWRQKP